MTTPVDELADRYVERLGELDPVIATFEGITGHDAEMTDYSPDGIEERLTFDRSVLRQLAETPLQDARDRVAAEVMRDQIERGLALADTGEPYRDLNVLACPVQYVRQCFDLMPRATLGDWEAITSRAALVPQALSGFEDTLNEGIRRGLVAAERQAVACAHQADVWGGRSGTSRPFFLALADELETSGLDDPALHAAADDTRRARDRGVRSGRPVPRRGVPAARRRGRRRRRGALRAVGRDVQRDRPRPGRDVRVGLGGAAPHRARDGHRRGADPARRVRRRRDRAPRERPDTCDRRCRRVP